MTDTQDLKRYKYGYSSDEWGMGRSLGLIPDPAGNVCLFTDVQVKLDAAQAEIERLKAITFEPGELVTHGINTPTPMAFGAAITKRLNDKWGAEVAKLKERLTNQEFWVADAIKEKDAALARLAELEKQDDSNAGVVMGFTPEGLALVDYPCEGNTISLEEGMLLYASAGASPVQPVKPLAQRNGLRSAEEVIKTSGAKP